MSETASLFIFLATLLVFIFTFLLKRFKYLSPCAFRYFWNYLLLFSFLLCAISGLLLAFPSLIEILSLSYFFLLKLHIATGLVMALISLFHALNHFYYYFPKKPKKLEDSCPDNNN